MFQIFYKVLNNSLHRRPLVPVILFSLLCHIAFFSGMLALTKSLYKSKEFTRPYTFELVKLTQVFEVPDKPAQARAPRVAPAAPKPVSPAPPATPIPQSIPEVEQKPIPSTVPTDQKPDKPSPTPEAPAAATSSSAATTAQANSSPGSGGNGQIATDKVYEEGMVDEAPVVVKKVEPFYPEFVKDQGILGIVKVQAVIDADGSIISVKVLSSPNELLSDEVVKAVSRWKYKPGKFKGVSVKARIKPIEIEFRIEN